MTCSASGSGAIANMNTGKKWYGIEDGRYGHEAAKVLMETNESWSGFLWNVLLAQPGLVRERYGKCTRMQNDRHSPNFHIWFTFAEIKISLSLEYEKVKLKCATDSVSTLTAAYCTDEKY